VPIAQQSTEPRCRPETGGTAVLTGSAWSDNRGIHAAAPGHNASQGSDAHPSDHPALSCLGVLLVLSAALTEWPWLALAWLAEVSR
jgi:hypothetical protein